MDKLIIVIIVLALFLLLLAIGSQAAHHADSPARDNEPTPVPLIVNDSNQDHHVVLGPGPVIPKRTIPCQAGDSRHCPRACDPFQYPDMYSPRGDCSDPFSWGDLYPTGRCSGYPPQPGMPLKPGWAPQRPQ